MWRVRSGSDGNEIICIFVPDKMKRYTPMMKCLFPALRSLFVVDIFTFMHPYGLYLIKIWQKFQTPIWPKGDSIHRSSDLTLRDRVTGFEVTIKKTSSNC